MAHYVEPMDVDSSICDFDNKENSLHHNNVLAKGPCTEKGYEELEVSELNMKLRYSVTPTSSPMSKSFTANCLDNKQFEAGDKSITNAENANLTRSMNSTIARSDSIKKVLPFQCLDQFIDGNRNPLQPLETTVGLEKDVTITVSVPKDYNENLSIPSSSSSLAHTPEATTPTKEFSKQDGGSPIMRGLKSVLSMFRPSQSPITTTEDDNNAVKPEVLSPPVINSPNSSDSMPSTILVSTPLAAQKTALSKKESQNRESIVFKDDLENELEWKDESTVIFSTEKIPIHKLFMTQNKPVVSKNSSYIVNKLKESESDEKLDSTVEYMDISYNDVMVPEKTVTESDEINNKNNITNLTESDSEFLDCETTFTKSENKNNVSVDSNQRREVLNEGLSVTVTNESSNNTLSKINVTLSPEKDVTSVVEKNIDSANENNADNEQVTNISEAPVSLSQPENESSLVFKPTQQDSLGYNIKSNTGNYVVRNIDTNSSSFCSEKLSENVVVSSLSQIALIADPRVLLFNIPDETSKTSLTQNIEYLNTTPADIPLPDDEDLGKVEVNDETVKDKKVPIDDNLKIDVFAQKPIDETLCSGFSEIISNSEEMLKDYKEHEKNDVAEPIQLNEQGTNENKVIELDMPTNTDTTESLPEFDQVPYVVDEVASIQKVDLISSQFDTCLETRIDKSSPIDNNEYVDVKHEPLHETKEMFSSTIEIERRGICIQTDTNNLTKSDFTEEKAVNIFPSKLETVLDDDKINCPTLNYEIQNLVKEDNVQKLQSTIEEINILYTTSVTNKTKNSGMDKIVCDHSVNDNCDTILEKNIQQVSAIHRSPNISAETLKEMKPFEDKEADSITENIEDKEVPNELPVLISVKKEDQAPTSKEVLLEETTNREKEIVASKDNSPFVAISVDDLEGSLKSQDNDNFENLDTKTYINLSPPLSPKIVSKGYNLNFDEIEDPFATKTKIRWSPSQDGSPNELFENIELNFGKPRSDMIQNRRKSQPIRKRPAHIKKMNSTFSGSSNSSIDHQETYQTKVIPKETKSSKICETPIKNDVSEQKSICDDGELKTVIDTKEIVNGVQDNKGTNECNNTSSSELSTYKPAKGSSCKERESKNVFNFPEIDSENFNPFATKYNECQSPVQFQQTDALETKNKIISEPLPTENLQETENKNDITENHNETNHMTTVEVKFPVLEEQNLSNDASNTTCSSKATDDKDTTVREVHTEDEDTIEGPFLEAEGLSQRDKMSDFGNENLHMMQCSDFPTQQSENQDGGELFIDAEAFEFLLNQNKANEVADSGKESLFLKFDPLYAKRMSSDGVVAALSRVQKKKQSTPKKIPEFPLNDITFEKSPVAGSSLTNVTQETEAHNVTEESIEDLNVTVTKPMMVVNPAVNPVPAPRNKAITPVRSNRQSLTFTSPAIAVIDRLLSMSANSSLIGHEASVMEVRGHNEADLALTQLRELLADKEISVYNLKSESKELKERLGTLESQMKNLEALSEERLKRINDLSDKLTEKTKLNKSMASVVEEYERTIASLISETEQERKHHAEERLQLINERDEQTRHLASMEVSFSDLHSKYEKSKQVIFGFKTNEDALKKSIKDFEENLAKAQTNYELLKQHATAKLNHANEELQKMNRAHETEVLKLNAMIKRQELHITSLEETLLQKTKANEELTAICDELINRVG